MFNNLGAKRKTLREITNHQLPITSHQCMVSIHVLSVVERVEPLPLTTHQSPITNQLCISVCSVTSVALKFLLNSG